MAVKTVLVGCKLPNGIILEHPLDPSQKVTLNGLNKRTIIGATHGSTEVPEEFFTAWMGFHKDFAAVKSGAIFTARAVADLAAKAEELKAEETGFEPMKTDGKDKRAKGVKTTTAKDD